MWDGGQDIEYLKHCGIIEAGIVAEEIPDIYFGRLFSLAKLLMAVER